MEALQFNRVQWWPEESDSNHKGWDIVQILHRERESDKSPDKVGPT
jgi:hypothetical protein